jgi:hypothetical protein
VGRRIAIAAGLGIAVIAVAVTASGPAEPTSLRFSAPVSAPRRGPLVGVLFDSRGGHARLARLDAATLRVQGPTLALPERPGPSARSRDGAQLALGSGAAPDIRVIALSRWRAAPRWRLVRQRVPVQALAWTSSRRLLALLAGGLTPGRVVVADPTARRVVASRRLHGTLAGWAPSALGITVILGPRSGIGPARLVHVDREGRAVTADLPGVVAGVVPPPRTSAPGQDPNSRVALPGVAIDERDRLAFVAAGDLRVLAVNLRNGRVVDLIGSAGPSPLERLRDWLEPPAQAKGVTGMTRSASYVGRGLLAVSGQDGERPYGLRLVDLNRDTVRLLSRGGYAYGAGGRVLTVGIGKTLRAFDADGRRVWSRFPRGGIRDLTIGPRYAYVLVGQRTYVLNPRTGATVRVLATGRPPLLLTT